MSQRARSISIFFPAFNDEKTIGKMVSDAFAVLETLTKDREVIVVNDGSQDGTRVVLQELMRQFPGLKVVHHDSNQGYGAALRTGFSQAEKDLVFYTDGDGQYDAGELPDLLELMDDSVDVVNGYKLKRADGSHRKLSGAIYNKLVHFLFRIPIRDVDCDFRLLRRSALEQIELSESSGAICVELIHKLHMAGCVFVETPVHHYPRKYGRSRFFTPLSVTRTLSDFFGLWWKLIVLPKLAVEKPVPPASVVKPVPSRTQER